MRPTLIAGNWKMNGSRSSVDALVRGVVEAGPFQCEVLLVPPFVFLDQTGRLLADTGIELGAQDVDPRDEGAVTGGIAATMLKDMGVTHVLVGHSERRTLFEESDETVAEKFSACLSQALRPILCVGESLEERNADRTVEVVKRQIGVVADTVGAEGFAQAVIAYEPVWAIGTGKTATPAQAEEVHSAIRQTIAEIGGDLAEELPLLYGGSVKADNVASLVAQPNIDGALVGGASLKASEFAAICRAAARG